MRIIYFADVRFPLERANGIQTMETCYALAERGHEVRLVVKPDTQTPARDPFAFYGLQPLGTLGTLEELTPLGTLGALENLKPLGTLETLEKPKPLGTLGTLVIERANVPPGAGFLQRVAYMSFAFGRAFGRTRADVIFTRDLGVASALLRMGGARPPLVYESHGYAPDVSAALPELIATAEKPSAGKLQRLAAREERVWRGADGYVTITAALAEDLATRLGPREHLAIVPDGMRLPAKMPGPLPEEPIVAYAGHLYAWKGVDVLLRAIAQTPAIKAVIVGGPEQEPDLARLKALAADLHITNRVTFTGLVPPGQVREHLERAAVLVLPNPSSAISTRFTSPLKLFEYMAARRAIVASDLPAIREVLRHNQEAVLVPPGNPGALAEAIQWLLADRGLAQRLADAAYARAPEFTWARRAERLEQLFSSL